MSKEAFAKASRLYTIFRGAFGVDVHLPTKEGGEHLRTLAYWIAFFNPAQYTHVFNREAFNWIVHVMFELFPPFSALRAENWRNKDTYVHVR